GYTTSLLASRPWSGTTVMLSLVHSNRPTALCAADGASAAAFDASLAESHICGAGEENTVSPVDETSSDPPFLPALVDSPVVRRPNRSRATAGFCAAARVLTTSTSWKPEERAVMRRSTPGSTSGYVAVSPDRTGAGSRVGQVSSTRLSPPPSPRP